MNLRMAGMDAKLQNDKIKAIGADFRNDIIELWKSQSSADFEYFYKGESERWLAKFWEPDSVFLKLFKKLDTTRCAEIACGLGGTQHKLLINVRNYF